MSNDLLPAITVLEQELNEIETKAKTLLGTVNMLRERAGMPPRSAFAEDGASGGGAINEIRPDTFYGKRLQTAVREYLEMRKAKGMGPAKPREIYDAVVAGGYQFDATSDDIALVGLRAMLRKRTQFFHKLPNGTYGLTAWYPHAKTAKLKAAADDEDDDDAQAIAEDHDD